MNWEVSSMPSKKSYFNVTLFRKNLTRFWPLWGGLSLMGSVLPLYLLLFLLSPYQHARVTTQDITNVLYGLISAFLPAISLIYALLAAMAVWSYLYHARSIGLMHSLPMDRPALFVTNAASGLVIMLLPYAIVGAFTGIILLAYGIFPAAAIGQTILAVVGESLFYFAAATFCAMITGHLLALPVFYLLGNFLAVLFQQVIAGFAGNFIFGYTPGSGTWVDILSPTVYFYRKVSLNFVPDGINSSVPVLENFWVVGMYALVGVALLVLSLVIYRLRRSESAGEVVAYRPLRPLFRYGVALGFALTFGQVLYELVWRLPFHYDDSYQMVPMWACMTVTGIIGYFVASMLLKKSLRVFRRSLRGPVMTAALLVILCGSVSLDLFHIAGSVPETHEVDSVLLVVDGTSLEAGQDDQLLLMQILSLHRQIVDSESTIREELSRDELPRVYCRLSYELANGTTMYRIYTLPIDPGRWAGDNSYDAAINTLFNSPEAAARSLSAPNGYGLNSLYFYSYWGEDSEIAPEQMEAIYAALQEDAARGLIRRLNVFDSAPTHIGELELCFFRPRQVDDGRSSYLYANVTVTTEMTNTILAMDEAGLLNQETRDFLQERGFPLLSRDTGTSSQEADGGSQGGTAETVQTGLSGAVTAHALG